MTAVRTSAPGKVVILGEYAVLEGAPALVMAINRRVLVTLEYRKQSFCSVEAPGWAETSARFHLEPSGRVLFDDPVADFSLVAGVIRGFFDLRGGAAPCPPFHLVLDSGALMERLPGGPVKLGLGSSAALTVALCHSLSYYCASQHDAVRTPELSDLIRIHSALQGRRGSGLDVAASFHGGLIVYQRDPEPQVVPSGLPKDLDYCFVWSGRRADTGEFLAAVDAWRDGHERHYRRIMALLARTAEAGIRAARSNESEGFLRALDDYVFYLEDLGNACDVDILSEPHRRLRELARRYGIVYKPCGAGGGDIGVGMSLDPESLTGFQTGALAEDYRCLSLDRDDLGVQSQSEI